MQSLVIRANRLIFFTLAFMLVFGCDYLTERNFRVINHNSDLTVDHLSDLIEEYFLSLGFKTIQEKEISYPHKETVKRFYVGEAYDELKFSKPGEYITIKVINSSEVELGWDQFGPNFQPKSKYFEVFKSKIQEYIKTKTGLHISIYEIPKG